MFGLWSDRTNDNRINLCYKFCHLNNLPFDHNRGRKWWKRRVNLPNPATAVPTMQTIRVPNLLRVEFTFLPNKVSVALYRVMNMQFSDDGEIKETILAKTDLLTRRATKGPTSWMVPARIPPRNLPQISIPPRICLKLGFHLKIWLKSGLHLKICLKLLQILICSSHSNSLPFDSPLLIKHPVFIDLNRYNILLFNF